MIELVKAAKKVVKLLDKKFDDVGHTGMILEGFGVDHAHAKLFPMHRTKNPKWKPIAPKIDKYFEKYEEYTSSHDYKRADNERLYRLAQKIRE